MVIIDLPSQGILYILFQAVERDKGKKGKIGKKKRKSKKKQSKKGKKKKDKDLTPDRTTEVTKLSIRVVSIDLLLVFFMSILYTRVYFRPTTLSLPHTYLFRALSKELLLFLRLLLFISLLMFSCSIYRLQTNF